MKRFLCAAVAVTSLLIAAPSSAQEMRVLTSWDSSYPPVEVLLRPMLQDIEAALEGNVTMRLSGPETVPAFEQFEPVSRGLFDILYTNGGYHYDSVGIGAALDSFDKTHDQIRESGIWDLVKEEYGKRNMTLIGIIHNPGFHLLLNQPLEQEAEGLSGRRIRGIPIYHGLIQELGGSPVVLPMPEIYPALERGVVDGAAWPTLGAFDARWYEVADYLTRPTFGQGVQLFLMNTDKWEALDSDTQEAITGVVEEWEAKSAELMNEIEQTEEQKLIEAGMTITEFTPEQLETVKRAYFESGIALAAQRDAASAERLQQLAEEAGLAP